MGHFERGDSGEKRRSMRVRYRKAIGVSFLLAGLGIGALNLYAQYSLGLLSGLVICGLGILYLVRTYFVVEGDRIVVKALLGPAKKIHLLMRPIKVRAWLADPADWALFLQQVGQDPRFAMPATATSGAAYLIATCFFLMGLVGLWQFPRWMAPRMVRWQTEGAILSRIDQLCVHLAEGMGRYWPIWGIGLFLVLFGGAMLWSRCRRGPVGDSAPRQEHR